jgi:hypothetical protein
MSTRYGYILPGKGSPYGLIESLPEAAQSRPDPDATAVPGSLTAPPSFAAAPAPRFSFHPAAAWPGVGGMPPFSQPAQAFPAINGAPMTQPRPMNGPLPVLPNPALASPAVFHQSVSRVAPQLLANQPMPAARPMVNEQPVQAPANASETFHGVPLKPGVPPPSGAAADMVKCVLGYDPRIITKITSTSEDVPQHPPGTSHRDNRAVDFLTGDPWRATILGALCGATYQQNEYEKLSKGGTGPHVHLQQNRR